MTQHTISLVYKSRIDANCSVLVPPSSAIDAWYGTNDVRKSVSNMYTKHKKHVEHIDSFKYLGVVLDMKLSFTEHVTAVQQKSQQRLHVLRKLQAFNVDPKLLLRLDRSIIEPLIMYCSTCYYPALSIGNRTRLLKISHVAAKIIGLPTSMLSEMIDHAILKKARAIAAESDHPLFTYFYVLSSRRRYRCIKAKQLAIARVLCLWQLES